MLGAAALDRFGDVLLGAVDRRFARFCVEPLQQIRGIVARFAFDLPDQQLLGLVAGQSGDALELVLVLGDELVALRGGGGGVLFTLEESLVASRQFLFEAFVERLALGQRRLAPRQRLFESRGLLPVGARLPLRLHQDVVGLLLGVEERLLLGRFSVALGVARQSLRLLLRASDGVCGDAFAVGDPDREHGPADDQGDDRRDQGGT